MDELTFSTNCKNNEDGNAKNKNNNEDDDVPDIFFSAMGKMCLMMN